ncbi:hypothetical protein [Streptomyces murinus]|uniref:hypothetical protein n=1 Tax=Streptomyces murinus TaxID=33900 RepID=UPI003F44955E
MTTFLELAIKQAQKSECHFRVGAVLAKGRRILAHAHNQYRNSPKIDFLHATFHAEEVLLRRTRNPKGAVAYVARINPKGKPLLARPCIRCQQALAADGVIVAHYTTPTGPGAVRLNCVKLPGVIFI